MAAAVAPDIDGIGIIPELLTRNTSHPLLWFSQYHHSLHTLAFALVCTLAAYLIAGPLPRLLAGSFSDFTFGPDIRKPRPSNRRLPSHPGLTAFLVFISFHLHLLCDLIGARGPDGDQWPIPYLKPFSNAVQLTWHGQWALNAWQNFVITGLLLAGHILDRLEVWLLAGGTCLPVSKSGVDSYFAQPLPYNFAPAVVMSRKRSQPAC